MIDVLLRFEDEAEFKRELNFLIKDGTPLNSKDFYIDVIGAATIKEGVYDAGGNILYDPIVDSRWHVNIRCSVLMSLTLPDKYKVNPINPIRGWY